LILNAVARRCVLGKDT